MADRADWTEHQAPSNADLYDRFELTVSDVLSPVIDVAKALHDRKQTSGQTPAPLARLTSSEVEVARLVARGLSYKEIAACAADPSRPSITSCAASVKRRVRPVPPP